MDAQNMYRSEINILSRTVHLVGLICKILWDIFINVCTLHNYCTKDGQFWKSWGLLKWKLTAIFLTSNAWSVAEHTIICRRRPSDVILGICLCSLSMSSVYPCFSNPSASSSTKKRHWVSDRCPAEIKSSILPGVPTTMSTWK